MIKKMKHLGNFDLPDFFNYPPYFTLQPPGATREVQLRLWKELILQYCRSQRIYIISLEQDFPLFFNPAIESPANNHRVAATLLCFVSCARRLSEVPVAKKARRLSGSLSREAKEVFLSALVSEGRAEWMDRNCTRCLILWITIQDWASYIFSFVKENGLRNTMPVEDIRSGFDTRGTELEGIDSAVLMRALRLLEQQGKAAIFKVNDSEGVKFI